MCDAVGLPCALGSLCEVAGRWENSGSLSSPDLPNAALFFMRASRLLLSPAVLPEDQVPCRCWSSQVFQGCAPLILAWGSLHAPCTHGGVSPPCRSAPGLGGRWWGLWEVSQSHACQGCMWRTCLQLWPPWAPVCVSRALVFLGLSLQPRRARASREPLGLFHEEEKCQTRGWQRSKQLTAGEDRRCPGTAAAGRHRVRGEPAVFSKGNKPEAAPCLPSSLPPFGMSGWNSLREV